MKKKIAVVLMVFMVLSVFTGCAQKPAEPAKPAAPPAPEKIVIKIGHVTAENHSVHITCQEFEKYVEQQTGGKVDVQIYPNAQLGGDRQMTEAVALGTLHICLPTTSALSAYNPKFAVMDMPFMFKSKEAAFKAVDGELGVKFNELVKPVGIRILGYNDNGIRHISNKVRPINEPKDLKGIKMRVMENPVFIDLFKALGTNPTPMSFGELYTGLQQGTVDGQENGASLVYASKFYEVQKYYSLTGHLVSIVAIIVNDKFYEGLPADIKQVVNDGVKKYMVDMQRDMETKGESEYLKKLEEAGMKINTITPENYKKFVDAVKPMHEKYKATIGQDFFDLALKGNQ